MELLKTISKVSIYFSGQTLGDLNICPEKKGGPELQAFVIFTFWCEGPSVQERTLQGEGWARAKALRREWAECVQGLVSEHSMRVWNVVTRGSEAGSR